MVKLPDQFSAGMAPAMAVRAITPPDLGFEAQAKGIQALAQGIASFAGAMGGGEHGDKQQDALDLVKADTAFHQGMGDITGGLANNGDYDTHADTFNRQTSELIPRVAEGIRNPQAREMWAARAGLRAVDAGQRVSANADNMRRQDQQSNLLGQLGTRQQQYFTYQNDADRETALRDMDHYIQAAKDSRLISPFQAAKYREQFITGTVYQELSGRDPQHTWQAITGNPYMPGQPGGAQPAQPAGPPAGPAGTMLTGTPDVQPSASEVETQGTAEKPITGRLVPTMTGGQPAQPSQPAATGERRAATTEGSPLQTQRARFAQELAENPALRQKVMAIAAGENLDRSGNLAVIESMMNRASMMGTPLSQEGRTTSENGYYAGYNPRALNNPQTRAMIEQNLQTALQGSNVANYGTDNSSGQWGRNRNASGMYTQVAEHGGELFSYPSRNDARGHDRYWTWREAAGGGTQQNPQAGTQLAAPQPDQQRYQIAQAPSSTGTATDASYGGGQPTYNGQPLPPLQGRFGLLSPTQRVQLLGQAEAQIHKKNTELYAQTQSDVDSGIAALSQTGRAPTAADGTTAIERARAILQPQDYQKALDKWNAADREYKTIAPLADMSEDQWDQHMRQMSPDPAAKGENYRMAAAIEKRANEEMDKIRIARASDPAGAVDSSSEVQQVRDKLRTPAMVQRLDGSIVQAPPPSPQEQVQAIVQARLAAQERLGIDPEDRRIISQGEAQKLLRIGGNNKDIAQLSDMDLQQRIQTASARAEALYGPQYAKTAMEQAIKFLINNDMRREFVAPIVSSMVTGQPVNPDDIRAYQMAHLLDPMAGTVQVLSGRGDTSLGLPAQAVTMPAGLSQPNKQQIEFIRQNPDKWQVFDRQFGAGSAARALGAGTGKAIQGPVTPGVWQSAKNMFTTSPESETFRNAQPVPGATPGVPGATVARQAQAPAAGQASQPGAPLRAGSSSASEWDGVAVRKRVEEAQRGVSDAWDAVARNEPGASDRLARAKKQLDEIHAMINAHFKPSTPPASMQAGQ